MDIIKTDTISYITSKSFSSYYTFNYFMLIFHTKHMCKAVSPTDPLSLIFQQTSRYSHSSVGNTSEKNSISYYIIRTVNKMLRIYEMITSTSKSIGV